MFKTSHIIYSLLSLCLLTQQAGAKKIALLIGVGKYAPSTRWRELSSASDIALITKTLLSIGFEQQNIITLLDSAATHDGITNAFENILLEKVEKGDIVFFHFSGHGQQLYDDNGDEEDGLDESIVPYDAPMQFRPGQKEKHIRDDYLNIILVKLRSKAGPTGQVIVSMDACHSGTGTRANTKMLPTPRGTYIIYGEKPAVPPTPTTDNGYGLAKEEGTIAPMSCFFGSGPQELNYQYETKDFSVGSLSYSLSRALEKADANTTCRDVFNRIRATMSTIAPMQVPEAEGNLDKALFNGGITLIKRYYSIARVESPTVVVVRTGSLQGVAKGTVFKLFAEGAKDTSLQSILAQGIATEVGIAETVVALNKPADVAALPFAHAYCNVQKQPFSITINQPQEILLQSLLIKAIKGMENVQITPRGGMLTVALAESGNTALQNAQGMVLAEWPTGTGEGQLLPALSQRIQAAARTQFFRSMGSTNENIHIVAQLIKLKPGDGFEEDAIVNTNDPLQVPKLKEGDRFKVHIRNEGTAKAYFALLDIQPNDTFNILMPNGDEDPASYSIEPLEEKDLPAKNAYVVSPPYGKECLKLIASTAPFDYSVTAKRSGGKNITALEEVEDGVEKKKSPLTRDAAPLKVHTVGMLYEIVK